MKVIFLTGNSNPLKKTCAAIGIFDGVHRGHQYLIKKMLVTARRLGAQPIVITFFPHPAHVLRPDIKLGYLTSLADRFRLLGDLGVSVCLVVPFNRSFAKIQPAKRQLGMISRKRAAGSKASPNIASRKNVPPAGRTGLRAGRRCQRSQKRQRHKNGTNHP